MGKAAFREVAYNFIRMFVTEEYFGHHRWGGESDLNIIPWLCAQASEKDLPEDLLIGFSTRTLVQILRINDWKTLRERFFRRHRHGPVPPFILPSDWCGFGPSQEKIGEASCHPENGWL
jgi:hypothetical protein